MRLGKGNIGIAETIRIDQDPGATEYLSLLAAKTIRGEIITGLAVINLIVLGPPRDTVNRGLSFAGRRQGFFLLTVQADGTVSKVETLRSVGFTELDERAARSLKKMRFHPTSDTEVRLPVNYMREWPERTTAGAPGRKTHLLSLYVVYVRNVLTRPQLTLSYSFRIPEWASRP